MNYQKISDPQIISDISDLADPPKELYYIGNLAAIKDCAAVVGSRRMTQYGRQVVEKLIPSLVFGKKTIVSGFMYGVDQYAHNIAMENGGMTIAVLGWGISIPLPGEDKILANKIIDSGGLIISEWTDQKATLWTFPRRNRIVAAISKEIYIVEAASDSGSLITANIGLKLKKKLFAVPGPITSKTSIGTNDLIKMGLAEMWTGETLKEKSVDDPILRILQNEPLTTNEIAKKTGKNVSETGADMTILLLSGRVLEKDGKYFINAS